MSKETKETKVNTQMKKKTFPISTENKSYIALVSYEKDAIETVIPVPSFYEKVRYYWGGIGWMLINHIYDVQVMDFNLKELNIIDGPIDKLSIGLNSKESFLETKALSFGGLTDQEKFNVTLFDNLYRNYHFEDDQSINTFHGFNSNVLYVIDKILKGVEINNKKTIRFSIENFLYELSIFGYGQEVFLKLKWIGITSDNFDGVILAEEIQKSSFLLLSGDDGVKSTMEELMEFEELDQKTNENTLKLSRDAQMEAFGGEYVGGLKEGMTIRDIYHKLHHHLELQKLTGPEPIEPEIKTIEPEIKTIEPVPKVIEPKSSGDEWDSIVDFGSLNPF